MTSEALVVDVSRDWMIACDVQQRFMQAWIERRKSWTTARDAVKCTRSAEIVMISCHSRVSAWH